MSDTPSKERLAAVRKRYTRILKTDGKWDVSLCIDHQSFLIVKEKPLPIARWAIALERMLRQERDHIPGVKKMAARRKP